MPERPGLAATHTRDVYYGYDLRNAPLYARFDSATGEGVTYGYDGFGRQNSSILTMDGSNSGDTILNSGDRTRPEQPIPPPIATCYGHDARGWRPLEAPTPIVGYK